jgi:tetratricopeptide (TPR) repeat protein
LGASIERQERFSEAIHYYKNSIKLDAEWDDGYFGVGICLCEMQCWFEAIGFLKKAISLDDNNAYYWLAMADAETNMGNILSGMEAYQKSAELEPINPEAWIKWSAIYHEQGDFNMAADLMLSAIDVMPEEAELYYRAAIYLIKAVKFKEAFGYLETALVLSYEGHELMFEYFKSLETQKAIFKIIEQYKQ